MSDVQVKNVSFKVGSTTILNDVSTEFKEKSLTCILGPNGAGKTTLIKAICRLINFEGEILINDKKSTSLDQNALAREVSYVPQSITPDLTFTVEEFVQLSRYPWHGVSEMEQSQMDEIFDLTGILKHKKQPMKTLSGGERQRVLIAAALIQDTPVILLDEITSALDPKYQDQIVQLLLDIRQTGKTLIWATHDINAALIHGDSLLAMKNGKVFSSGTQKQFLENGTLEELYEREFQKLEMSSNGKTVLI